MIEILIQNKKPAQEIIDALYNIKSISEADHTLILNDGRPTILAAYVRSGLCTEKRALTLLESSSSYLVIIAILEVYPRYLRLYLRGQYVNSTVILSLQKSGVIRKNTTLFDLSCERLCVCQDSPFSHIAKGIKLSKRLKMHLSLNINKDELITKAILLNKWLDKGTLLKVVKDTSGLSKIYYKRSKHMSYDYSSGIMMLDYEHILLNPNVISLVDEEVLCAIVEQNLMFAELARFIITANPLLSGIIANWALEKNDIDTLREISTNTNTPQSCLLDIEKHTTTPVILLALAFNPNMESSKVAGLLDKVQLSVSSNSP